MTERIAVRVVISGRVQGVWYRGWTVERARAAGLCGWVRNRKDGTVEAVFAGPPKAVEAMIAECRDGPPLAKVDAIAREDAQDEGWTGFSQMPTTA
ncbi:MAG: acylphosphatase [Tagaea sp. CACIAM 22H2]|nr:acylphosphatase [Tagaea sp. CACIAM 22H2]